MLLPVLPLLANNKNERGLLVLCFWLTLLLFRLQGAESVWKQGQKLFSENPDPTNLGNGDQFGGAVAIFGDTLVVGATQDRPSVDLQGAAYVYKREGKGQPWTLAAVLVASDFARGDSFGWAVALDANYIVVSAHLKDETGAEDAGAVYIYNTTDYSFLQKLNADVPDAGDKFGYAVSLYAPLLVVGAAYYGNGGSAADYAYQGGAVYVFDTTGGPFAGGAPFQFKAKVVPPPELLADKDSFGYSVSLYENTFVSGLIGRLGVGAAYVYTTTGTDSAVWTFQQALLPKSAKDGANVGRAVAIENNLILIGAARIRVACEFLPTNLQDFLNKAFAGNGIVYLYKLKGTKWDLIKKLKPRIGAFGRNFGSAVAIHNQKILVGAKAAYRASGTRRNAGAVYVYDFIFHKKQCLVKLKDKVTPFDVQDLDWFGSSVSLSNDTMLVGSPQENEFGYAAGAAYTFDNKPVFGG